MPLGPNMSRLILLVYCICHEAAHRIACPGLASWCHRLLKLLLREAKGTKRKGLQAFLCGFMSDNTSLIKDSHKPQVIP